MSTIMHGVEAVTPFNGVYRRFSEASLFFDVFVLGFEWFLGTKSA
jgi:hypothetical protein